MSIYEKIGGEAAVNAAVDIFYRNASPQYQKILNSFGVVFLLAPMLGVIGYYSIDFISVSWAVKESSTEPGGLGTVFIQKSFIFLFPMTTIFPPLPPLPPSGPPNGINFSLLKDAIPFPPLPEIMLISV